MIYERYSDRQKKKENAGKPDVYQYNMASPRLRQQVVNLLKEIFKFEPIWEAVRDAMRHEIGVEVLPGLMKGFTPRAECSEFIKHASFEDFLDITEMFFKIVEKQQVHWDTLSLTRAPVEIINELNFRCQQDSLGFKFQNGEWMRIDSEWVHSELIKNCLSLLQVPGFQGAEQEFLAAHEHYRHGRTKETLNECLKAMESTIKIICGKRGWTYDAKSTIQPLIQLVIEKGLISAELTDNFRNYAGLLQDGVPRLRNRMGGHGQGEVLKDVPRHVAAFALHLTASNIVFLCAADTEMR